VSVLQEIETAHEQLQVAEEDLQAQADGLLALRGALDFERRRYRALFAEAPVPYLTTDADGLIVECNQRAEQLFNLTGGRLVGKPLAVFVPQAERHRLRDALTRMASDGSPCKLKVTLTPRSAAPVHVVATLCRARDEHARVQLRWMLSVAAGPIQGDRAPAVVTHGLRSHLNAMRCWLELLLEPTLERHMRERAHAVLAWHVQTMSRLIDQLTDALSSKPEMPRFEPPHGDVLEPIGRAIESHLPAARRANVQILVELEALGQVRADADAVEQTMMQLLSDALKLTPPGGHIEVRARAAENVVEIAVATSSAASLHARLPISHISRG
jgi:PAS domain S-box-containing protein